MNSNSFSARSVNILERFVEKNFRKWKPPAGRFLVGQDGDVFALASGHPYCWPFSSICVRGWMTSYAACLHAYKGHKRSPASIVFCLQTDWESACGDCGSSCLSWLSQFQTMVSIERAMYPSLLLLLVLSVAELFVNCKENRQDWRRSILAVLSEASTVLWWSLLLPFQRRLLPSLHPLIQGWLILGQLQWLKSHQKYLLLA